MGNRQHWLGLRLLDSETRHDAMQARVEVLTSDGAVLWRRVHTDGSYCTASDPRLLVGLGGHHEVRKVRVHWSHDVIEEWENLAVDRYWTLVKGKSPGR